MVLTPFMWARSHGFQAPPWPPAAPGGSSPVSHLHCAPFPCVRQSVEGDRSAGERVDLLVRQASRHDDDRDREGRRGLSRDGRYERAGAVLAGAGGEDQEGD